MALKSHLYLLIYPVKTLFQFFQKQQNPTIKRDKKLPFNMTGLKIVNEIK